MALRQARRAEHRAAEAGERNGLPDLAGSNLITESNWTFAGSGHQPDEIIWADDIRNQLTNARALDQQREAG